MLSRRTFTFAALALPIVGPAWAAGSIKLRDLYNKDRSFSDLARAQEGQRIAVIGFMAPPLKANARFFVLTKKPLAVCPFCETEVEWPDNILAVYTKRVVKTIPFNVGICVTGILELGPKTDNSTGFVSLVRLDDASYG